MNLNGLISKLIPVLIIVVCFVQADNHLAEGIQYLNNGEYEKAKAFFNQKIKENKNNDQAYYYLGRTHLMSGEAEKAVDHIEKAIEMNDHIADYHYWLAQALGRKAQNSNVIKQAFIASKILKEFERTIELDSMHLGGHVGVASFYIQAPSIMGGDLEKARREAAIIQKLDARQGRLMMIALYEKEGKFDLAQQEYEKFDQSFNDSTDNYQFYNSYGYFLLRQKKYEQAIEKFQKQVRLAPDKANPHDSLGDAYRAAGRLEEALAEYRKAVEIDPSFKASLKNMEELQEQLQKKKK